MNTLTHFQKRILAIMCCMILVITGVMVFVITDKVFGASTPKTDESGNVIVSDATVTVTDRDDSGVTRKNNEVPGFNAVDNQYASTDMSQKYTKNNPFVVLEIVPDKAYQTLSFLTAGSEPFDPLELEKETNKNAPSGENQVSNMYDNNNSSYFSQSYTYYTDTNSTTSGKFAEFRSKKYTIKAAKGSDEFMAAYDKLDLAKDGYSYDANRWNETTEYKELSLKGYFVRVRSGEGDYAYEQSWWPVVEKYFTDSATDKNNNRWKYVEEKPENGTELTQDQFNNDWNYNTGDYIDFSQNYYYPAEGMKIKQGESSCVAYYYRYQNNEILKRTMFRQAKDTYDNIYLKVVVMTPDELNTAIENDNTTTVDIIERADMFYLNGVSESGTDTTSQFGRDKSFYFKYCEKNRTDQTLQSYGSKNDIEWLGVSKILKRCSGNTRLPLIVNSRLYHDMNEHSKYKMFYAENNNLTCTCNSSLKETTCNVLKLMIIVTKYYIDEDSVFMKNYYDKIQMMEVNSDSANVKYTGFYSSQNLCSHSASETNDAQKKSCYYTWSCHTFYPYTVNEEGQYNLNKVTDLATLGTFDSNWFKEMDTSKNFDGHKSNPNSNVIGITGNESFANNFNNFSSQIYEILNNRDVEAPSIDVIDSSDGILLVELNKYRKYKNDETVEVTFTVTDKNVGIVGGTSTLTVHEVQVMDDNDAIIAYLPIKQISAENGVETYTCQYPSKLFYEKAAVHGNVLKFRAYSTVKLTDKGTTKTTKTTVKEVALTQMPLFDLQ